MTLDKALLWTDERYWIVAEQQMDCNWELMKEGTIDEERDPNDPGKTQRDLLMKVNPMCILL